MRCPINLKPSNIEALIDQCIHSKSLQTAKLIHQHTIKTNNIAALDKLTHLYATCNDIEHARKVFDKIPNPRVLLWNLLIRGYAWNGPFREGIQLFCKMVRTGTRPSNYTFSFVIKVCSGLGDLRVGREVHCLATKMGFDRDVYICTALVDFYSKSGDLNGAKRVFRGIRDSERDVVAWNAMISGFSLHGFYDSVVELVIGMGVSGVRPNSSSIVGALPVLGEAGALREGKVMHGYCLRKGFNDDMVAATGILDMYAKCGCIGYAKRVFRGMRVRNEVTWSAMIGACVTCDLMREAIELFDEMIFREFMSPTLVALAGVLRACAKLTDLKRGRGLHCFAVKIGFVSELMVSNTLLSLYAKCGVIGDASSFFDEMRVKDTVSYSAIISGYVQNGRADEAVRVFREMYMSGVHPDLATMVSILPACAHLAALQHGACCHSYAILHGYRNDTSVCNALIDMYAKCGKIKTARQVFDTMHKRDIVSWNTMIIGYGLHGLGVEALSLFYTLQAGGLKPDEVTFICLLSACSHSGLVTEGKRWFDVMSRDFSIIPRMEHYICMTDLLGRAGLLAEAHDFIQEMPLDPDVRIWGTLLAACKTHRNIKLGELVSEKIQILGPESPGNLVLLSNMYSTFGRWDDAAQIRIMQRDQGLRKSPGCSWVEINGVVHAFIGGDQSHPATASIEKKLDELLVHMKRLGYSAETNSVYQDVDEEEKERILLHHSEKLAIAYAILNQNPDKPILVTKNLRVCGDCHAAIKLITLVTKREISVRDTSRFHHFKDGICNCGDFW